MTDSIDVRQQVAASLQEHGLTAHQTLCSDDDKPSSCLKKAPPCSTEECTPPIPDGKLDLSTLLEEVAVQLNFCKDLPLAARLKIKQLLSQLDVDLGELNRYMFHDPAKKYTRNLIANDETFTLMLLCWNPAKESPIHDHPCQGCWMRVVSGSLEEFRYRIHTDTNKLEQTGHTVAATGDCIYIDDDIGLHKIRNPSLDTVACSLHLYSPPFQRCCVWLSDDAPADKPLKPVVTYFSEYGEIVSYDDESALTS